MPRLPFTEPAAALGVPRANRRAALRLGVATAIAAAAGPGAAWWQPAGAADLPNPATLPAELQTSLPGAQALGSGSLRFLGLDIYAARLWVTSGFVAARYAEHPFALELTYFRGLSGKLIAERSLKEMRRQGSVSTEREQAWLDTMLQAFPDVKSGDRITGLHTPGVGARFWHNGQLRPGSVDAAHANVADVDFSRVFFGIWLSDATSEPQLRNSLLGRGAP